jgi:hypothetical protein
VSSDLTVVGSRLCCQNLEYLWLRRSENYLKIIFTNRTKKLSARTLKINEYVRGDKNRWTGKNTNAKALAIISSLELARHKT